MTTLAQRISETPEEPVAAKSNRDIIREKFKHLHISADTKQLVEGLSLSESEMQDERTQYIRCK